MLTLQDCIDLCELTQDEIDAIAIHEHLPEIIAAELAQYLVHDAAGIPRIRAMIRDDIEDARRRSDHTQAAKLVAVLRHFIETHPQTPATARNP